MSSPFAPTEQFNTLPEEEKKRVLSNGLGMDLLHSGLTFAIPLWWLENNEESLQLCNGSAFLADFGSDVFAVTAAHVFQAYQEAKRTAVTIACQLGNALFDPEERLICCRADLDIATFRVNASEVEIIGKSVVTAGPTNWEPLSPEAGNFAFFAGFSEQTRGMTPSGNFFATVPYFAMTHITSVTDHQITCRFNRAKMIDFSGSGLPPPGYNVSGVSGGPLLVPTLVRQGVVEGVVWRLGGVIVQAAMGDLFEQIVAVRAHYIQPDGRIG